MALSDYIARSIHSSLFLLTLAIVPPERAAGFAAQSISGPEALSRHLMDLAIADLESNARKQRLELSLSDSTRLVLQELFDKGARKIPWDKGDQTEIAKAVKLSEANALVVAHAVEAQGIKTGARGGSGNPQKLLVSKASVRRALAPSPRGKKRGICPGLFPFC